MKLKCGQIFESKKYNRLLLVVGTPQLKDRYCTLAFDDSTDIAIVKQENILKAFVYIGEL